MDALVKELSIDPDVMADLCANVGKMTLALLAVKVRDLIVDQKRIETRLFDENEALKNEIESLRDGWRKFAEQTNSKFEIMKNLQGTRKDVA